MRGNKPLFATLLGIAVGALFCAPASILASTDASAAATATPQLMQASGGLTLGSVVLIAIAGAVVTFGKSRVGTDTRAQESEFNLGNHQVAVHSRLSGDQQ